MDDERIVELYWKRNENAISETATKYGSYLNSISYNILFNNEDALPCPCNRMLYNSSALYAR